MTDSYQQGLSHPFLSHLIALLSTYELCPMSTPPPRYDGPTDWQTDTIIRSLGAVARRMYTAEETLTSIKASECWQTNGPDTKKRRSVGNTPISSSCSSQKETNPPSSLLKQSSTIINAFTMSPGSNSRFSTTSSSTTAPPSTDVDVDMTPADSAIDPIDGDRTPSSKPYSARANSMSLSLDGIDAATLLRSFHNGTSASAPSTSHIEHVACPTCGKAITDTLTMSRINGSFSGSPSGSPLVVPPGPLMAAAFESGMSAVEELRLLKAQVQDVARVCNAVARGDLSQKITVTVQGVVMVQLKDVINTMVFFSSFYPRSSLMHIVRSTNWGNSPKRLLVLVRKSVQKGNVISSISYLLLSPSSKLGGQALVLDVEGTWRELTGVVNKLAANLTNQVRSIAKVTKAVALGDLSKQIDVDARGEILDLKNTVNGMVVQLRALAAEVTRVTLEVGSQGKLGGQAHVPDVQGVWFELVRNVWSLPRRIGMGV